MISQLTFDHMGKDERTSQNAKNFSTVSLQTPDGLSKRQSSGVFPSSSERILIVLQKISQAKIHTN